MNKGKKAIKVVIAILIAAVAFGYGGYTTMRPGVYVGDDFFYEKVFPLKLFLSLRVPITVFLGASR